MNYLKQFIIPFSGLSDGEYWFDFKIETAFFECFEDNDIQEANIVLKLQFIKRSAMLELEFNFSGTVKVECDRCLGPVDLPVKWIEKIFVKFGDEKYDESSGVLVIPFNDPEIDITKLVYEMIYVALPMKRVHIQGECDGGIEDHISREENNKSDKIDPRWEQLRNL